MHRHPGSREQREPPKPGRPPAPRRPAVPCPCTRRLPAATVSGGYGIGRNPPQHEAMGAKERGGGAVRAVARGAVGADDGLPERGLSVLRRFALPLPRLPLLHDQVQDRSRAHALRFHSSSWSSSAPPVRVTSPIPPVPTLVSHVSVWPNQCSVV